MNAYPNSSILKYINILLALYFFIVMQDVSANDQGPADIKLGPKDLTARIYRNPEERREAGLGTKLTDKLKFSGLLEIAKEYSEENLENRGKNRVYADITFAAQFAFEYSFAKWMNTELIYEVEHDGRNQTGQWDEAFISLDFDALGIGIEAGRVSAPFGEYYSHFATGPLLEFGETIRNGLIVDYELLAGLDITGFIIDSDVKKMNKGTDYDWGAAIEYTSITEAFRFGIGYLSDLAESDERFLQDENDEYERRVSAWNAYTLIGFEDFEITAEYVLANNKFREFDDQENKPSAYNLELAYFPVPQLQVAVRLEGSDEFADKPEQQYGVSVSWCFVNRLSITTEYLFANFKNNFAFDDEDNEIKDRDMIAAELSIEF